MTSAPAPTPAGMPSGRPPLGAPVLGRFTKWGDGRHWEWVGHYLGADEFGHWWYAPAGTRCVRPGVDFVETDGWVSFVPHEGAYAAGFYPAHRHVSVYVDMTTEPVWQRRAVVDDGPEWEVTMVDLDLDVVLTREGHLFVDDEDEFAEHQVALGYPPEIVTLAERWRDRVLAAVAAGDEPFGSAGHEWLRRAEAEDWGRDADTGD
ncbi:MAG TPA: DUF402 domain-containing protein [Humibacillus xanthopallidus]|nr:DUF402 domain-containing protein [Humibacillus xanthopallidus]